jgi:hypothetical protein
MSTEAVESILSRAMSDAAFADSIFDSTDQALAGYDLSVEETITLKGMTRADFDTLMASPEERKSMGFRKIAPSGPIPIPYPNLGL